MEQIQSKGSDGECLVMRVCEDVHLQKTLISFARQCLPADAKAEAEDIFQDALIRYIRYVGTRQIEDPVNYLRVVIKRLAFDFTGRQRLTAPNMVQLDAPRNEDEKEVGQWN